MHYSTNISEGRSDGGGRHGRRSLVPDARGIRRGLQPVRGNKRLVVIFQRGAADGLNIVIPHAEPSYYAMRPSIAIPRKQVIDLNGFFGLHPSLAQLQAAVGPGASRDCACRGLARHHALALRCAGLHGVGHARREEHERWLAQSHAANASSAADDSPFAAVALGTSLPRILSGKAPAVAVNNVNAFGIAGGNPAAAPLGNTFEAMYDAVGRHACCMAPARETFEAVKMLKSRRSAALHAGGGRQLSQGRFGDALRQTAQLIKANLGVQIAFTDIGGWDHHVNEGAAEGQLANVLRDFGQSIAAFWVDLGPLAEETVIVTMSEFGRTARENGNRGTDHGHANVMFVLGGPVRGGRVYGRWPGLDPSQLNEGRDLALTTDFRRVVGEAVARHLGNTNLNAVFPGYANLPGQFLRYLG